jgi:hypothetical protein
MDVFLKIVKGLSKNDKQEVNRYIRLDDIISIYRNSNIRKKVTPARFTKGVSDICASELFKAELKKKGIGEIESIYSYINGKIKATDYLVKCLKGDKKYLKPIDLAYLYFLAKDPVNAVAACDKGIKEAKTDLEKASLIIDKATYCKATDPNTFEQCRKDIAPYKDKLDKRLVKKFQAAFPDVVSKNTVDINVGINVLLPVNGGVLSSFTSEYSKKYAASSLTDGEKHDDGWSSAANPGKQEFVYSFKNGKSATLKEAVIRGGTAEGKYYSKDVAVLVSVDGKNYMTIAKGTLPEKGNCAITLDLGKTVVKQIKLVITSGYRTDRWELGEFEVYGDIID